MDKETLKSKIWDCTISFEELDDFFGDKACDHSILINELLQESLLTKNADAVEYLIYAVEKNGVKDVYVDVLCQLLNVRDDWQYKHEDIATLLGKIEDPKSVPYLYKLAEDYETSDMHSIPLKAMWSLRLIGNEEAVERIKKLTLSSDEKKAGIAKQQLEFLQQKEEST
jgi:hypothetical protein